MQIIDSSWATYRPRWPVTVVVVDADPDRLELCEGDPPMTDDPTGQDDADQ